MGCVQNKQNIIIKTTQSHFSKKKTLNFFKEQNEKSQNNTIMNKSSAKAQLIMSKHNRPTSRRNDESNLQSQLGR